MAILNQRKQISASFKRHIPAKKKNSYGRILGEINASILMVLRNLKALQFFLTKNSQSKIETVNRDINGRYVICKIRIEEYDYCFANIYAPNEDNPKFFDEIRNIICELNCTYNIIGGDFNVTLHTDLDRNVPVNYHSSSRDTILSMMETENLVDIWRIKNPDTKRFTWIRTKPSISWSRIDYFLISNSLNQRSQ